MQISAPDLTPSLRTHWGKTSLPSMHPLYPWLTERGSLTAYIAARCKQVSVRVLSQQLAIPHRDEAVLLNLSSRQFAWLREVVLEADGVPVVYARSVLPCGNVRGAWGMFAHIGHRPLGAALFAEPRIKRGALTNRRLDERDVRYHRAVKASGKQQAAELWARRSCFYRYGRSLMVCEVFLVDVLDLSA